MQLSKQYVMRIAHLFISIFICYLLVKCKSQTNEEKMQTTSKDIVKMIRNGQVKEFEKSLGVDLLTMGKDEESLKRDVDSCQKYLNKYKKDNDPDLIITNEYNHLGMLKVIVPLLPETHIEEGIVKAQLELFFGPPQMVPLDKISGFNLVIQRKAKEINVINPQKAGD